MVGASLTARCGLAGLTLALGCILEDNPDFIGGGGVPKTGCDDPSVCATVHVGPGPNSCLRQLNGAAVRSCDWSGADALGDALSALGGPGRGGLIILYDNEGAPASYVGGLDVFGGTTIRAAPGVQPESIRVSAESREGVIRLREDGVHLQGLTLVCRSGGQWGIVMEPESGPTTGFHLIENMRVVATGPENVGANSISGPIQAIGPQTTVRNTHVFGYWEDPIDMRAASDGVFSHNTVILYQLPDGSGLIDARDVDRLEISNNVFVSLTAEVSNLVVANDATDDLIIVGNAFERYANALGGLEVSDPEVTLLDNTAGALELESPLNPRVLADSSLVASIQGVAGGTSLDGVPLSEAPTRRPGAYQILSPLTGPRRETITVGEQTCGGARCDITQTVDNELQRAVWSAWPGSVVEVYPSAIPYAGPVVISWPVVVRGMGEQPEDVVVRRQIEDDGLEGDGQWAGKDVVVDLTRSMGEPSTVERLTIEAGSGQIGLYHEGSGEEGSDGAGSDGAGSDEEGSDEPALDGHHEIRRVIVRDDGELDDGLADTALYVGNDVVVHDVLVHGGFDTCVRVGPRAEEGDAPTPTTAYVHHFTCRLTEALPSPETIAAFEVAGAEDLVIADAVVELVQLGPLFRAQRRGVEDDGPIALDVPTRFTAHSITARGYGTVFDGFTDADGEYTRVDIETLGPMTPLFVSASDSRLAEGSSGIDRGVDPATLAPALSLRVSLDGQDRSERSVDRGCYEQGS